MGGIGALNVKLSGGVVYEMKPQEELPSRRTLKVLRAAQERMNVTLSFVGVCERPSERALQATVNDCSRRLPSSTSLCDGHES